MHPFRWHWRILFGPHCLLTPSVPYKHSLRCMIYLLPIPACKQRGTKPWGSQTSWSLRRKVFFFSCRLLVFDSWSQRLQLQHWLSWLSSKLGGSPPWKQFTPGLFLEGQAWAWRLSRYRHIRIFSQKGAVRFKTANRFLSLFASFLQRIKDLI